MLTNICKFGVLFFCFLGSLFGEMEVLSEQKILENSDVIARGRVRDVSMYRKIDGFNSYYRVIISKLHFKKGLQWKGRPSTINVYYRDATKKGVHTEHAPILEKGDMVNLHMVFTKDVHEEGWALYIPSKQYVEILKGTSD